MVNVGWLQLRTTLQVVVMVATGSEAPPEYGPRDDHHDEDAQPGREPAVDR